MAGFDGSTSTKAAPVTTNSFHASMGAYHYAMSLEEYTEIYATEKNDGYDGKQNQFEDGLITSYSIPHEFANLKLTQPVSSQGWIVPDEYEWDSSAVHQYFEAYAPYEDEVPTLSVTDFGRTGLPAFTYTVPQDVSEQVDLVYGSSAGENPEWGNCEYSNPLPMTFWHILSAVRFVTKDIEPGVISKISLKGVYSHGYLDFAQEHLVDSDEWKGLPYERLWTQHAQTTDFTQDFDSGVALSGDPKQVINDGAFTFIMLPQILPSGASMEIVYTPHGGTPRTLSADLSGMEWGMGMMYEYNISTSGIGSHIEVLPPIGFSYQGGTESLTVKSWNNPSDGTKQASAWTLSFMKEGDDGQLVEMEPSDPDYPTSWLHLGATSGNGSMSGESISVSVDAQTSTQGNSHNAALSAADGINHHDSVRPYNLSNDHGRPEVQHTANCYIVNAAGEYSIPLVYGNAIKNSQPNTEAYTSRARDTQYAPILGTFVNHRDVPITDPYIYNNAGCVPHDAVLIWQDESGLVRNVDLTTDKRTLLFEVPYEDICQGNAIVAVRDEYHKILWSWHIWVTDYVPLQQPDPRDPMKDKVVENYTGHHYTFMPVNLGWCDNGQTTYPRRTALVRVANTQGKKVDFSIVQKEYDGQEWSCPLYQWGRKDPMLPLVSDQSGSYQDKHSYDVLNGTPQDYAFVQYDGPISIGEAIMHPYRMYNAINYSALSTKSPNIILRDNSDTGQAGDWNTGHYANLWSADNISDGSSDIPLIKTIYDPCPYGYRMPYRRAFSGMSYQSSFRTDYVNSPHTDRDVQTTGGWRFYCNLMPGRGEYDITGGTYFLPLVAGRSYYNDVLQLGTGGTYYMTAGTFEFDAVGIEISGDDFCKNIPQRKASNPVRPIRE